MLGTDSGNGWSGRVRQPLMGLAATTSSRRRLQLCAERGDGNDIRRRIADGHLPAVRGRSFQFYEVISTGRADGSPTSFPRDQIALALPTTFNFLALPPSSA